MKNEAGRMKNDRYIWNSPRPLWGIIYGKNLETEIYKQIHDDSTSDFKFSPSSFFLLPSSKQRGFTLIELLLSLSITSVILLAIALFLSVILQSRIRNQAISEVEEQGRAALSQITQTIRNGTALNAPVAGATGALLSITTPVASTSPTLFGVSSGVLQIKEGTTASTSLTNSRIVVSGFSIENLTRSGTPGIARITFTISATSSSNRSEYSYQKTFIGSASIR